MLFPLAIPYLLKGGLGGLLSFLPQFVALFVDLGFGFLLFKGSWVGQKMIGSLAT